MAYLDKIEINAINCELRDNKIYQEIATISDSSSTALYNGFSLRNVFIKFDVLSTSNTTAAITIKLTLENNSVISTTIASGSNSGTSFGYRFWTVGDNGYFITQSYTVNTSYTRTASVPNQYSGVTASGKNYCKKIEILGLGTQGTMYIYGVPV